MAVNIDIVGSVASGVSVAVGVSTCVASGAGVRVAADVDVDVTVGTSVEGKIRLATDCPKTPDATLIASKTKATTNHCCPASVRARRVR